MRSRDRLRGFQLLAVLGLGGVRFSSRHQAFSVEILFSFRFLLGEPSGLERFLIERLGLLQSRLGSMSRIDESLILRHDLALCLFELLRESSDFGALFFELESNFVGVELDENIPFLDLAVQIHRAPQHAPGDETHHRMGLAPDFEPSLIGDFVERHASEKEPRDPTREQKNPYDDTDKTPTEAIGFERAKRSGETRGHVGTMLAVQHPAFSSHHALPVSGVAHIEHRSAVKRRARYKHRAN